MRIIDLDAEPVHREDRFHSVGFDVLPLARTAGSIVRLRLEPGGVIGRHEAVGPQLFCVVAGAGTVAGGDGVAVPICPGQAALWDAGESHETRSADGLTALVAEGREITVLIGRAV